MNNSDDAVPSAPIQLRDEDIESRTLSRREALRRTGLVLATAAASAAASACLVPVSDTCTLADPAGAASDYDPWDPYRSDYDVTACDAD